VLPGVGRASAVGLALIVHLLITRPCSHNWEGGCVSLTLAERAPRHVRARATAGRPYSATPAVTPRRDQAGATGGRPRAAPQMPGRPCAQADRRSTPERVNESETPHFRIQGARVACRGAPVTRRGAPAGHGARAQAGPRQALRQAGSSARRVVRAQLLMGVWIAGPPPRARRAGGRPLPGPAG